MEPGWYTKPKPKAKAKAAPVKAQPKQAPKPIPQSEPDDPFLRLVKAAQPPKVPFLPGKSSQPPPKPSGPIAPRSRREAEARKAYGEQVFDLSFVNRAAITRNFDKGHELEVKHPLFRKPLKTKWYGDKEPSEEDALRLIQIEADALLTKARNELPFRVQDFTNAMRFNRRGSPQRVKTLDGKDMSLVDAFNRVAKAFDFDKKELNNPNSAQSRFLRSIQDIDESDTMREAMDQVLPKGGKSKDLWYENDTLRAVIADNPNIAKDDTLMTVWRSFDAAQAPFRTVRQLTGRSAGEVSSGYRALEGVGDIAAGLAFGVLTGGASTEASMTARAGGVLARSAVLDIPGMFVMVNDSGGVVPAIKNLGATIAKPFTNPEGPDDLVNAAGAAMMLFGVAHGIKHSIGKGIDFARATGLQRTEVLGVMARGAAAIRSEFTGADRKAIRELAHRIQAEARAGGADEVFRDPRVAMDAATVSYYQAQRDYVMGDAADPNTRLNKQLRFGHEADGEALGVQGPPTEPPVMKFEEDPNYDPGGTLDLVGMARGRSQEPAKVNLVEPTAAKVEGQAPKAKQPKPKKLTDADVRAFNRYEGPAGYMIGGPADRAAKHLKSKGYVDDNGFTPAGKAAFKDQFGEYESRTDEWAKQNPAASQPKPEATPKPDVKQKEPWEMTRKEFKGEPKLYTGSKLHKNETAKKIYESTKPMPHEPFMDGLTIQKGPHQFVVFDGNTPVATYSSGDNLVVNPKYRRRGIGQTLLEQYKAERDAVPRALSRSKEADRLYDKVHNKFVKQALREGKPVPAEVLADYPDLKPKAPIPNAGKRVEGVDVKPDKDGNTWKVERESGSYYLVHRYRNGKLDRTTRVHSADADVLREGAEVMTPTGHTVGDNRMIRFAQMGKAEQSAWVSKIKKARANKSKTSMWLDDNSDVRTGFNPNNNRNRYLQWDPLNEAARVAQEKLKRFDPTPRWERTPKEIQGKSIYLYARSTQGKMSQPLAGPFHTHQEAAAAAREVNARIRKDFDQNSQYALDGLSYGAVDPGATVTVKYPDLRSDGPSPFHLKQLAELTPTATKGHQRGSYVWDDKAKQGVLRLFASADPSTVIHEMNHHFLQTLSPKVQAKVLTMATGRAYTPEEAEELFKSFGKKGSRKNFETAQEIWAEASEHVMRGGGATPEMPKEVAGALANYKTYMESVYEVVRETMVGEGGALAQGPPMAPTFYSKAERVIDEKLPAKASAEQIRKTLFGAGVKPEEMKYSGLDELLDQGGAFTKTQLKEHLLEKQVKLVDVTKGGDTELKLNRNSKYAIPEVTRLARVYNGDGDDAILILLENDYPAYEALMRKFPELADDEGWAEKVALDVFGTTGEVANTKYREYVLKGRGKNYTELLLTLPDNKDGAYYSSHWDEPNVLAHIRFDERQVSGQRALHVAEIQSDWHQDGRKNGYQGGSPAVDESAIYNAMAKNQAERHRLLNTEPVDIGRIEELAAEHDALRLQLKPEGQVPDAPFKKTWHELAFKKVLREAAEKGFDRLTWDTGATSADRYHLSKQVERIVVPMVNKSGTRSVRIDPVGRDHLPIKLMVDADGIVEGHGAGSRQFTGKPLDEVIGKEIADRVMQADEGAEFSGDGLKVGGEGMKGFYDKILPEFANKYLKKWGVKVESATIDGTPVHSVKITPELRESVVSEGQPLFQNQGKPLSQAAIAVEAYFRERYGFGKTATKAKVTPKTGQTYADRFTHHKKLTPEGAEVATEILGGMPFTSDTVEGYKARASQMAKESPSLPAYWSSQGLSVDEVGALRVQADAAAQKIVGLREELAAPGTSAERKHSLQEELDDYESFATEAWQKIADQTTAAGRMLRFSQEVLDVDFDPARVLMKAQAVNGGEPVQESMKRRIVDAANKGQEARTRAKANAVADAVDAAKEAVETQDARGRVRTFLSNPAPKQALNNLKESGIELFQRRTMDTTSVQTFRDASTVIVNKWLDDTMGNKVPDFTEAGFEFRSKLEKAGFDKRSIEELWLVSVKRFATVIRRGEDVSDTMWVRGVSGIENDPGVMAARTAIAHELLTISKPTVLEVTRSALRSFRLMSVKNRAIDVVSNLVNLGVVESAQAPLRPILDSILFPNLKKRNGASYQSMMDSWNDTMSALKGSRARWAKEIKDQFKHGDPQILSKYNIRHEAPGVLKYMGRAAGATDIPFKDLMEQKVAMELDRIAPDLSREARDFIIANEALEATFNNDNNLNRALQRIESVIESGSGKNARHAVGLFIDLFAPFPKVLANITGRVADYGFGGVKAGFKTLKGRKDGFIGLKERRMIIRLVSRNLIGLAVGAAAYYYSQDKEVEKALAPEGFDPQGLYLEYPNEDAEQLSPLLKYTRAIVAARWIQNLPSKVSGERNAPKNAVTEYQRQRLLEGAMRDAFLDSPITSGNKDVAAFIEGRKSRTQIIAGKLAGAVIPAEVRNSAKWMDRPEGMSMAAAMMGAKTNQRKAASPLDELKARLPWLREQVPMRK